MTGALPESPPPAQALPIDFSAPAFAVSPSDLSQEQLIGIGAGAVALTAIGLSLFMVGQGARLSSDAGDIEKETAQIQAATPRAAQMGGLEADRRKLAAYAEIEAQTNPLSAAGAAIGIVAFHDLTPTALEAESETLTLTLPYTAVALADTLIADFEGSGYFYDIRPRSGRMAWAASSSSQSRDRATVSLLRKTSTSAFVSAAARLFIRAQLKSPL